MAHAQLAFLRIPAFHKPRFQNEIFLNQPWPTWSNARRKCCWGCYRPLLGSAAQPAIKEEKIEFTSLIRFRAHKDIQKGSVAKLENHIWLTASSSLVKYLRISSYIRKPFLMYDFATDPIWISLLMRKISFSFLSVWFLISTHKARYCIISFWSHLIS